MRITPIAQAEVDKAERKIDNILEDLEEETNSEVQDIDLEDVVETDPATGKPGVHKTVDVTVQPRPQRKWLK